MRRRDPWLLLAAAALAATAAAAEIKITGQVFAGDGTPIAGAAAELLPARAAYQTGTEELAGRPPVPAAAGVTDEDGRFELTVPEPWVWSVRLEAPGFVPMVGWIWDPVVEELALPPANLRRDEGLEVVVRDAAGGPATGAMVFARTRNDELWADRPAAGSPLRWSRPRSRGSTDERGRTVLHRAAGETLDVYAVAHGSAPARPARTSGEPVELRLRRVAPAPIEVVDGRGLPVPGALVTLGSFRWPLGLTGEDGRLTAELTPGWRVFAVTTRGGRGQARIGETATGHRVVVAEPDLVRGTVIDATTRLPIAGALVLGRGAPTPALTDGSGRFALLPIPDSWQRTLLAAAPGYFTSLPFDDETAAGELVVTLEPAAAVSGEVVDESGQPVAGAAFAVRPLGEGSFRGRPGHARSRADGSFRFAPLPTEIGLELRVEAAGYAPARRALAPLPPGATREGLRLVLSVGATLRGRVAGDGEPVVGAEVRLLPEPEGSTFLELLRSRQQGAERNAVSGTEGRFELHNLAAGSYLLRASAAGYAPLFVRGVRAPGSGEVDLGLLELEHGAAVQGRVVDTNGRPVGGAEIGVTGEEASLNLGRGPYAPDRPAATTDAEGRFELPDRRPGERLSLTVSHPELRPVEVRGVEAPTERPLQIVLPRGGRLSGTVVDPGGGPIAGAILRVRVEEGGNPDENLYRARRSWDQGPTGADGRFELDVPSGRLRLAASADGRLPTVLGGLVVAEGGELTGLRLVLRQGATVGGRVLDADGSPASGFHVEVRDLSLAPASSPPAVSDGDGRYLLTGVEPGLRTIVVHRDSTEIAASDLDVRPGANRLDLRLTGGVEVSGRVVDADGAPVPGAVISLYGESGPGGLPSVHSGADGLFVFERVRDGRYLVAASAPGYAGARLEAPLQIAGAPVSGLEISLTTGSSIYGELLGLEPAQTALVSVGAARADGADALGRVAEDGSYRIDHLAPGAWTVIALVPSGARAQEHVTLAAGRRELRVDLDLATGLVLSGRVLTGGRPAAGLTVQLSGGAMPSLDGAETDAEGRFRIAGIAPGAYRVEISGPPALRHRVPLVLDGDRELLVEIPTGRIQGRVVGAADRAPLAGVQLTLLRLGADGGVLATARLWDRPSDAGGRFVIPEVAAGDYRLRAVKDGYAPLERRLTVAPGADLEVALELEPSDGLQLTVRGPTGAPVPEIEYAILDGAGRTLRTDRRTADADGRLWLPSVPDGTFVLLLAAPGAAVLAVTAAAPGPLELRLGLPCRLEVTVPALSAGPSLATLRIVDSGGRPFRRPGWQTAEQSWPLRLGRVTVAGLPAGAYTVLVESADGRRWQAPVELTPGPAVELRL